MQGIAVLPRMLGSLLYYSPAESHIKAFIEQINTIAQLYDWPNKMAIVALCATVPVVEQEQLIYQFSVLFEGQGEMIAPPWGSVYLDRDNLLMSQSLLNYRQFLTEHKLSFNSAVNEPEDQCGLMLLVLAVLLENQETNAVYQLLEQHLLPWAPHYLERLINNSLSPFYATLALITQCFFDDIQRRYALSPIKAEIYF